MSRLFSLGAKTCLKLKQLEEAINWCDKGLAVSFLYPVHRPSVFSIEIFMCAKENKNCGDLLTCNALDKYSNKGKGKKRVWTATVFRRRVNTNSWPHKLLPPLLLQGQINVFFFSPFSKLRLNRQSRFKYWETCWWRVLTSHTKSSHLQKIQNGLPNHFKIQLQLMLLLLVLLLPLPSAWFKVNADYFISP